MAIILEEQLKNYEQALKYYNLFLKKNPAKEDTEEVAERITKIKKIIQQQ